MQQALGCSHEQLARYPTVTDPSRPHGPVQTRREPVTPEPQHEEAYHENIQQHGTAPDRHSAHREIGAPRIPGRFQGNPQDHLLPGPRAGGRPCFSLKLNSVDFYKAKEGVNYITRASGSGKNPAVILSVNSYSARFQKFYHIFVGKSKKWPVQKFRCGTSNAHTRRNYRERAGFFEKI